MKTFLLDILPKIQRYSEKLDSLTLLTNKHWVHITDNHEKLVYIFRAQHNQLLISRNGLIEKAHWEHLGNNSFLVDQKNGSYLFKHGFIDDTVLALKTDGNDQFALFINESKFSEGIDTLSKIVAHLRQKYLDNEVGEFIKPIQDSLTLGNQKRVKAEKEKRVDTAQTHNYSLVQNSSFDEKDFKLVQSNGKWGFIDPDKNLVIDFIYDDAFPFSEGLASVTINGKKGFINRHGECVIDFQFERATFFKGGRASVTKDEVTFDIDQQGNPL